MYIFINICQLGQNIDGAVVVTLLCITVSTTLKIAAADFLERSFRNPFCFGTMTGINYPVSAGNDAMLKSILQSFEVLIFLYVKCCRLLTGLYNIMSVVRCPIRSKMLHLLYNFKKSELPAPKSY